MSRLAADVTNSAWARNRKLVCTEEWDAEIASEGVEEGKTNIDVASSRHLSQCFIYDSLVTEVTVAVMQVPFQPSSYTAVTSLQRGHAGSACRVTTGPMPVFSWDISA
jgi:hypothetical protein